MLVLVVHFFLALANLFELYMYQLDIEAAIEVNNFLISQSML
jgi:hypothetical protein